MVCFELLAHLRLDWTGSCLGPPHMCSLWHGGCFVDLCVCLLPRYAEPEQLRAEHSSEMSVSKRRHNNSVAACINS